jgi:hypothetical protein
MKSFLRSIAEQVQNESDFEKAQSITLEHIRNSNITEKDKRAMIVRVQYNIKDHQRLVKFIYDNILKFEGLGVI